MDDGLASLVVGISYSDTLVGVGPDEPGRSALFLQQAAAPSRACCSGPVHTKQAAGSRLTKTEANIHAGVHIGRALAACAPARLCAFLPSEVCCGPQAEQVPTAAALRDELRAAVHPGGSLTS